MIGSRTCHSLAQFLELQEPAVSLVLLSKYGAQHLSPSPGQLLFGLLNTFRELDDRDGYIGRSFSGQNAIRVRAEFRRARPRARRAGVHCPLPNPPPAGEGDSSNRPTGVGRCRKVGPSQAVTICVRTSTLSARLMAAKTAEMLLMVGLPDFDSIRCRLLAGLSISPASASKPTVALTRSRRINLADSGSPSTKRGWPRLADAEPSLG